MKTYRGALSVLAFSYVAACSTSAFDATTKSVPDPNAVDGNATGVLGNGSGSGGTSGSGSGGGSDDNGAGTGSGSAGKAGNASTGGTGSSAGGGSTEGSGSTAALPPPPPPPNINFGLLVNDLNCTMCHVEVHGSVVSLADALPLRDDSNGKIFGKWLVAGVYEAADALDNPPRLGGIVVTDGVVQNYDNSGKEMPISAATGKPSFPVLDFTKLDSKMQGSLTSPAMPSSVPAIAKVLTGNAVLVGTADKPIVINRDVLVKGDLVIKGVYTGVGTIYVTGNIYIPANLKAAKLASLPYSDDPATADTQAKADLTAGNKDALGLASAGSIFIGDIENYTDAANGPSSRAPSQTEGVRYTSIYSNDPGTAFDGTINGVWNVYKWIAEADFEKLYEATTPCFTSSPQRSLLPGHQWGERTFTELDAYLYAVKVIAGVDRAQSWTLNGGMISQSMHIVSGADSARIAANMQCPAARINFDYRLQNGMQTLEQLGSLFPQRN